MSENQQGQTRRFWLYHEDRARDVCSGEFCTCNCHTSMNLMRRCPRCSLARTSATLRTDGPSTVKVTVDPSPITAIPMTLTVTVEPAELVEEVGRKLGQPIEIERSHNHGGLLVVDMPRLDIPLGETRHFWLVDREPPATDAEGEVTG